MTPASIGRAVWLAPRNGAEQQQLEHLVIRQGIGAPLPEPLPQARPMVAQVGRRLCVGRHRCLVPAEQRGLTIGEMRSLCHGRQPDGR